MRRELLVGLTLLFLMQAAATSAMSPAQFGSVSASGVIDADKSTVTAPRITSPRAVVTLNSFARRPNVGESVAVEAAIDASVNAATLESGSAPSGASGSGAAAQRVAPAGILKALYVAEGQRVAKGARLAKVDDTLLRLAVSRNHAALSRAKARLLIVEKKIASLEHKERELEDARDAIAQGRAQLADARAQLRTARTKLDAAQAKLAAEARKLARIKVPRVPPRPTPSATTTPSPAPPKRPKLPNIVALKAKLAQAQAQLAGRRSMLEAGFAKLNAAEARLNDAEAKLDDAEEQLAKAKRQLAAARRLAGINIRLAKIGLAASRTELSKAVVQAPVSGVVTDIGVAAGELVFSNQPILTVSELDRVKLRLYFPPDEAHMVRTGQRADVRIDTFADRAFPGKVARIGSTVDFAPSNIATERTYLSTVQAVTLEVDNRRGTLKPGMPADAEIHLR